MFRKIIKLIEDYAATAIYVPNMYYKLEVDVFKNSSYVEIAKVLKTTERGSLRFFMNSHEDYIVWDALKMIHSAILKYTRRQNPDIQNDFGDDDLRGIIFSTTDTDTGFREVKEKCIYLYFASASKFYMYDPDFDYDEAPFSVGSDEAVAYIKERFATTHLYKSVAKLGITEIVVGAWL